MRTIAAVCVVLAAACATFSLDSGPRSIVPMVSEQGGTCTAWAVAPGKWITAKHCIVMATGWTMGGVALDVIALDPKFDIALLAGPKGDRYLSVSAEVPPLGATVQALGYGMGQADLLSFSGTVVGHESLFFGSPRGELLVTVANGMPGMSGGPILYRGEVVSLITGGGIATTPMHLLGTGVTWASLSAFTRLHLGR